MSQEKTQGKMPMRHSRRMGGNGGPGGPLGMVPGEKAKDFKGSFKRLMSYIGAHKGVIIFVFLMAITSSLFGILTPKVLSGAMNILYDGFVGATDGQGILIDFEKIRKILVILAILYILNAAFSYVQQYLMAGVGQKVIFCMRKEVDEKLTRLPIQYFDNNTRGDILSRMSNDIDNVGNSLQQASVQIISSIITIVGVFFMMLSISPVMTLLVLLTLPLIILVTLFVAKRSQKYFSKQWETLGNLNGHIEEIFTGATVVKAYGYEEKAIEKFKEENVQLYEQSRKAQFVSGIIMPLMNAIGNLSYVLICIVGGMKVINGSISFGDVTAFIQYQKQFSQPITQTANMMNVFQSALASAERVFAILDEQEEQETSENYQKLADVKGKIVFEHVKFGYQEGDALIKDMNIHVKPGQLVAIVGPTGAGKTTLVNLLMRFYEINAGKISVDGVDIRDIRRNDLRDIFGMVLQDTWLFSGTIYENIAYGSPQVLENEVIGAARAAHVHRFIKTLSHGYDTILNEEGTNVSQGQKQLLTIARAMISDPSILILDEATSSVDTRTEILIQRAMEKLLEGRTSFVIAHRLSTIRGADLILVMKDGDIIEQGTHEELMRQGQFYAELYNSQFAH